MNKGLLVYNPSAGRLPLTPDRLAELTDKLRENGWDVETFESRPEGQSLPLRDKNLLIVYGGDGTIHDVISEAIGAGVPIAIIPSGTANVLAHELGLPLDQDKAIEVIGGGRRQRIHVGRADGHHFHLMGGVGPDAYLNQRVHPALKKLLGVGAYWLTGLTKFWSYRLQPFDVRIDGKERLTATFAVVSNARFYGGRLLVTPQASLADDVLDVCLFTSTSHLRFFRYLVGAMRGRHLGYADVVYRKARSVEISGEVDIPVQLDGEMRGRLPITFSIGDEAVDVCVPA